MRLFRSRFRQDQNKFVASIPCASVNRAGMKAKGIHDSAERLAAYQVPIGAINFLRLRRRGEIPAPSQWNGPSALGSSSGNLV